MKNKMKVSLNHRIKVNLLKVADRLYTMSHAGNAIAPPAHISMQYGSGSYFEVGLHFFKIMLDECGIQRHWNVLDVGCGIGRVGFPLTAFLRGRYDGFDIMPQGIEYCSAHIT